MIGLQGCTKSRLSSSSSFLRSEDILFFRGEDKQSLEKPKKHVEKTQPLSYLGGESSKNSVLRVLANIGTSYGFSTFVQKV